MSTLRINVWSGPRNVSTALMYSFAQRADTRVVDEPLYAHYLTVTDADQLHPGADETKAAQFCDGQRVIDEVMLGPCDKPALFCKQMAHHLVDVDRSFLRVMSNVLLTRNPRDMLPSLAENIPNAGLRDTGYATQTELYQQLCAWGQEPPVVEAMQLLLDPPGVLRQLCQRLGIPFDPAMLSWPAGPRPEDGVWAKYWYDHVHRSTGFAPYRAKTDPFPAELEPLLEECLPHYEVLESVAIKAIPEK